MAVYRQIYLSFWTDSKIDEDFTPEDKYFYLYLLTNPHTNLCGCYEVGTKQMARETGYNEDTVKHLIKRLETVHNVIRYCRDTKEILLINWWKHNWTESDRLLKGVEKSAAGVKCPAFKEYISALLNNEDPKDTLCIPYTDPMDTSVSVTVTDTVTDIESINNNNYYTEDFEKFWETYPKKVGKKEAYKAFRKARMPLQTLLDAVKAQMQTDLWKKENGRFIPNPATWLNQGRWDDEVAEKAAAADEDFNTWALNKLRGKGKTTADYMKDARFANAVADLIGGSE